MTAQKILIEYTFITGYIENHKGKEQKIPCNVIIIYRYKKLWAKHQKRLRGLPNWKLALAFKDGKFCKGSPKSSSRSSSSSSSGRSSRSISECIRY